MSEELVARRDESADAGAFGGMLAGALDPAFRLAMTMLKDRAAAEDAVQEAALKAWRKRGQFWPQREVRPWFLAIVANECRTMRRSRWRGVIRLPELWSYHASTEASAESIDLDTALDRLPQHHLLPLTLYYHLDLPIDDVARVLGCSVGAARQRIHRALNALRPGLAVEMKT